MGRAQQRMCYMCKKSLWYNSGYGMGPSLHLGSLLPLAHAFKIVHSLPKPGYFLPCYFVFSSSYFYPYLKVFMFISFSYSRLNDL